MDRELLIEIGVEEVPASWLPPLTTQLAHVAAAQLKIARLDVDGPVESWTTPRRLTVRASRVAERQTDLEEVVSGPPASTLKGPDGAPMPAAVGFAKKNGVEVSELEEIETPKGATSRSASASVAAPPVDALPDVMYGLLAASRSQGT
jgi:glycyl-tRNA synthetase beta chain